MIQRSALHVPGQWLDLVVESGDSPEAIGEVLLKWDAQDPTRGEVRFVFHPSVHETGLATEAVTAALKIAFDQFTWERVIGVCDKRNLRSAALMERIGMRREAEFKDPVISKGEWTTQLQYAMTRGEWKGSHVIGDRGRTRDQREIEAMMSVFFSAFELLDLKPMDLIELRWMFLADAIVVIAAQCVIRQYDVDSFIHPGQELLESGRLRDFSEWEVTTDTEICGDIAQRWSLYSKLGTLDGRSAEGWGTKGRALRARARRVAIQRHHLLGRRGGVPDSCRLSAQLARRPHSANRACRTSNGRVVSETSPFPTEPVSILGFRVGVAKNPAWIKRRTR